MADTAVTPDPADPAVLVTRDGTDPSVAVLTLNRPAKYNALTVELKEALLAAYFHHKRRVWFLEEVESICPSCANGCNIKLGMFRNEIQRLLPRRNDAVNDTWMCDHGRLNYHFAQDQTRVRVPRTDGITSREGDSSQTAVDTAAVVDCTKLLTSVGLGV